MMQNIHENIHRVTITFNVT